MLRSFGVFSTSIQWKRLNPTGTLCAGYIYSIVLCSDLYLAFNGNMEIENQRNVLLKSYTVVAPSPVEDRNQ